MTPVGLGGICNEGVGPRLVSQCLQAPTGSDCTQFKKRQKREKEEDE